MSSSCLDPIFKKSNICPICTTKQGISFHFFWSNFPSKHVVEWFYYIICFLFYKQNFYNQPQAEIDKKTKQMLSNTLRMNFYFLNIILILHQRYHSKNDRTYSKKISKITSVCVDDITQLIIMEMKMKINHIMIDAT